MALAALRVWGTTVISSFFLFFPRLISATEIGCLPYFYTWCGPTAKLECRSKMCCAWLAGNAGPKKSPSGHHRTTLSGYIFATKARINNREKNLLNSNASPTCPHNMVNFGLLAAEICWRVWGTTANFNGFARLGSVTARHSSSGCQPNFAALNRGRYLYSAGWPSCWAFGPHF